MLTVKSRAVLWMFIIIGFMGLSILVAPLAVYAHGESLSANPPQAMPGDSVIITGKEFDPGVTVPLALENASGSIPLGNATTDQSGVFTVTVTIPAKTSPGSYQLACTTSDGVVTMDFAVQASGGTSAATTGGNGTEVVFERSNAETIAIGIIVAALIAAGTFIALAGTERARLLR